MTHGRKVCDTLKSIRKDIADANDIKYEPRECTHEGECAGTCPACEAEVRYLENELNRRSSLGKKVALVGISAGLTGLSGCGLHKVIEPPLAGIPVMPPIEEIDTIRLQGKPSLPPSELEAQQEADPTDVEPLMGDVPAVKQRVVTDTLRPLKADEKVLEGIVEEMPMFRGGDQALQEYLKNNMRYPDECMQGRVVVTFWVEKDGTITEAKVVKSVSEGADAEALRLVNAMPKWQPGKQLGKAVRTKYTIPISFQAQ